MLGAAASPGVRAMARRFIVGRDADDAAPVLAGLYERGVASTVDLLGEATVTDAEADAYTARCHDALEALAAQAATWPERPQLERDGGGAIARANLSVKISAMTAHMRAHDPERGIADVEPRLRGLLRRARDLDAHIHVDMESADTRESILELVLRLMADPELADGPSIGCVLQAYMVGAEDDLERLLDCAAAHPRATPLTVRLVKGAYWDHETVEARLNGWTPPVQVLKVATDRAFERLTRRLIDARPLVRPAIASHNLRSLSHAIAYNRHTGGRDDDLELQVLRGLGDDLQDALSALRLRVRTYCPLGDLVAGMAYLVRRLLENTSNDSFLAMRAAGADLDTLLAAP
jgi:RHH-type proline utilization regulon transcriptional repressor/proline dehydrogenase/delta 1-pyrroline-5-carboxylate dehydrogenase